VATSISASRAEPGVIKGNNIRCGVLDHILGLQKEQPAREPKGKNPAGVGVVVLTLTAATASDGYSACRIISTDLK